MMYETLFEDDVKMWRLNELDIFLLIRTEG